MRPGAGSGLVWNGFRLPRPQNALFRNLNNAGRPVFPYLRMRCVWHPSWVRLQGELLLSEASSADPLIERVYARERAELLARHLERGPLLKPKPEIGEPDEPEAGERSRFTIWSVSASPWPEMRNACDPAERWPAAWSSQSQQFWLSRMKCGASRSN